MASAPELRITGGELRGRRLHAPTGEDVRPSTGRTREAIFSMLGPLEGERVLDLFAGTGALALEALSRGAGAATLVDRDLCWAERNVEALGLGEVCELVAGDVQGFLEGRRGRYDLVFCDPPYRLADRLGPNLDKLLPELLAEGARVIVESATERPLRLSLPLLRERAYGASFVAIHEAGR